MGQPLGPAATLREFLRRPTPRLAVRALRIAYLGMYLAQVVVALVLGATLLVAGGPRGSSGSILGPVLVVLALVQCLLGVALPRGLARRGGKEDALAAALLSAVLLAIPVWFLMLAVGTGQRALPVALLVATAAGAYALGLAQAVRLAGRVAADLDGHASAAAEPD